MDAESLVRTYADMIYKIAYRYTRQESDAEDVFSEVWLSYFKKDRTFESEEHRKAWLIRVTINTAKDLLSKRTYHEEIDERMAEQAAPEKDREAILDLREALARMKPAYKEAICLYYLQELPIKTIAEILGQNENTVKTHLMRGREELRGLMGET